MKRLLGIVLVSGQTPPDDLKVEDQSTTAIITYRLSSASKDRKVIISRLRWERKYSVAYFFGAGALKAFNVEEGLRKSSAVDRSLFFFEKGC